MKKPKPVENFDWSAAIKEMMDRYPKTLAYLAEREREETKAQAEEEKEDAG